MQVYQNDGKPFQRHRDIIFFASLLSGTLYCSLSLHLLYKHGKNIKNNFSYTEKIDLRWLFNLTVGLLCIWVIAAFAEDQYTFAAIVVYVLFIGYFGIKQVGIFTDQKPTAQTLANPVSPAPVEYVTGNAKYEKSSLSQKTVDQIHRDLEHLMQTERLYRMPGLSLPQLAKQLDVHPNSLSQVINRKEKRNFFDYVNSLRVAEFKNRLASGDIKTYTLLSLAHDCGFNSKTSFNRNFKSITGLSPSEYLEEFLKKQV